MRMRQQGKHEHKKIDFIAEFLKIVILNSYALPFSCCGEAAYRPDCIYRGFPPLTDTLSMGSFVRYDKIERGTGDLAVFRLMGLELKRTCYAKETQDRPF